MKVYSYSGKGSRETNEDYIKSELFSDSISIHIVADGMGGYLYGEIASMNATNAIVEFISRRFTEVDIISTIKHAITLANEQIFLKQRMLHAKLGATIAGVFIVENIAYAFWIGDVQIQHFRNNELLFVSENHSFINEMKRNGFVSEKDIERYKNIVTRSLSGSPLEEIVPIVRLQLNRGDIICISSDGFYNSFEISSLLSRPDMEIDDALKKIANTNEDNFSIIKITV